MLSPLSLSHFSILSSLLPSLSLSHVPKGDHTETYARMRLSDLGQFEAAATEDGATSDQEETSRLTQRSQNKNDKF